MQASPASSRFPAGLDMTSAALGAACLDSSSNLLVHNSLDSDALLQGQKSVNIVHNGTLYRLQATKLGKLILTK